MSTVAPAVPAVAAPAAASPAAPVLSAEEEFDAAFLEANTDVSVADEIAPPTAPAAAPAAPAAVAATPPAVETPAAPPAEPAAPAAPVVETPPAEPEKPAAPATSDAVAEQLRLLREELTPEPVAAAEPAAAPAKPIYSDEDIAALAAYEKDWPDISKAEELKRRKEYRELLQYAFAEVARVYGPAIQSMQESDANGHYNEIVTAHADYDKIVEPVKAWVKEQSPARRAAFTSIVTEGSADEIIDLIDLYKQAKGIAAPPAVASPPVVATPAAPAPAAPDTGTPPAAKQAAQRLSVVNSKRTAAVVTSDPNDFDAAFDEFAKAAK